MSTLIHVSVPILVKIGA